MYRFKVNCIGRTLKRFRQDNSSELSGNNFFSISGAAFIIKIPALYLL